MPKKTSTSSACPDDNILKKNCKGAVTLAPEAQHLFKISSQKRLQQLIIDRLQQAFVPGELSPSTLDLMSKCGSFMSWITTPDKSTRSLLSARFCHKRFCPVCMVRRARRDAVVFEELMRAAEEGCPENLVPVDCLTPLSNSVDLSSCHFEEAPAYIFIFLTLTASSPELGDLRRFIQYMSKGWSWLVELPEWKATIAGYIRKFAITINSESGKPHPHLHAILAVRPSYLTAKTYPLTVKVIRDAWSLVMGHGGYSVDVQHGVNLKLCVWDEVFRKELRRARAAHNPDALIIAKFVAKQAMADFYAQPENVSDFFGGEIALDSSGRAHLPRELAQYSVQLMEIDADSLTKEVLRSLVVGLKDVKFTTFGGLFMQLRRRQLAGKLILKPLESDPLKFRFLENFSGFDGRYFHAEYLDLGDDYTLDEARILGSDLLREKAEEKVIHPDWLPGNEARIDREGLAAVVQASQAANYFCSAAEDKAAGRVRLSYYQRLRLMRYCAKEGIDPEDFEAAFADRVGRQKLFTCTMYFNAESEFPDEVVHWKFFERRRAAARG